jgi:hypothetical protein
MARSAPNDDLAPLHERSRHPARRHVGCASLLTIASLAAAFILVLLPHAGLSFPLSASVPQAVAAAGSPAATCSSGNVVVWAHSLVIPPDQWICGDADAYGGSVRVQGHVSGNVTVVGGSVVVSGEVDGNIMAFGGGVTLLSGSRVAGNVEAWGGTAHATQNVELSGTLDRTDRLSSFTGAVLPWTSPRAALPWPWVLGWAVLAAVVVTLFPERTWRVRRVMGSAAVRSGVVGLLTFLLGMGLAGLLFVTCIGIPISLLLMVTMLVGWVLGSVAIGLWLGELLLRALAPQQHSRLLRAVVGMAVLASVEIIPCVGGPLAVIAGCIGLGAALISRFGSARRGLALPAPAPWK